MPARIGHIYRDDAFYADPSTGELKQKYFLVLAAPRRGDVVARLLTSRYANLRPENPPCFHGDPYPGYYLGVLGEPLGAKSWLDLRPLDDLDRWDFARHEERGRLHEIMALPAAQLRDAMECTAGADDTTRAQEQLIRDELAALPPTSATATIRR
ncbi:MAG: hypothetical protein E6R11_02000 [Rhodocyclaceae bacterium]|nr:MAG: hypothetical protein E6R11_02000 [Rhodocyclaceae bacterium]